MFHQVGDNPVAARSSSEPGPAMRLAVALLLFTVPVAATAESELFLVESVAQEADHAPVRAQARELAAIYDALAQQAGVEATLVWSTDPQINAFATEAGDEKIVIVQEGLLAKFGSDRDAVAAVLGHELAHHKADHIRAGRRKQEGVRVLGAILGAVVGAKVGRNSGELAGAASSAAVGLGAGLLALKFSRNQELEADRLALQWMIDAGYNPNGMLRLQEQLGALAGGKRGAAILSTHPTSAKRYQAAQKRIAQLAPSSDLLASGLTPLVNEEAIAAAATAIESAEAERIAQALKPDADDAPTAAALKPIDGIDFATYAAIGNQLLHAGDAGKGAVLKRHRLDDAKLTRLNADFTARMQEHPALAQRYSVEYFRASQGRFAAHGRDLADSFEHGQALRLDPPYPLETGRALHLAVQARLTQGADAAAMAALERELLQPEGLNFYDYLIAHNWWSRKVMIAALAGDAEPMQAYFTAPRDDADVRAEAAESGVVIGEGVTIGDNVRIGGKAVKTTARDDEGE
jgi:Zn-dependent protease with chaperone function